MVERAAVQQTAEKQAIGSRLSILPLNRVRAALAPTARLGLAKYGTGLRAGWLPAILLGAMSTLILPGIAHAQLTTGLPSSAPSPVANAQQKPKPVVPMAPALPGAAARAPAAPATQRPTDMSPNAALFDAINRGDIGAARDALDRGADLSATNILGLTPLELSIDLGRNDISFLLLSMRGEDGGGAPAPDGTATGGPSFGGASLGQSIGSQSAQATKPQVTSTRRPSSPARTMQRHPVSTRQVASDSGTPIPSAGFLGFGPHPASN